MTQIIEKNKPSIIVNFAAQSFVRTSWNTPEDWFKTNTLSSIKLAHYLKKKIFKKIYSNIYA